VPLVYNKVKMEIGFRADVINDDNVNVKPKSVELPAGYSL
jgi:hypothetical protein